MSAKSETQHIRGEGCICDPFDLAAMGHMLNCPMGQKELKDDDYHQRQQMGLTSKE